MEAGSPASAAGLRRGDRILAINGKTIVDVIDFMFHASEQELNISLLRDGNKIKLTIHNPHCEALGVELVPPKVETCRNKCVFCFVSQLPKGLRRSLYVKDEDYRMSFLYGNYVTLSNLDAAAKRRIVKQRLSPLYISVHATENNVRKKMLQNPGSPDIMRELEYFAKRGISMHTQIVLCPGYNDKAHLRRTLGDLSSLYPAVMSIAVVPVGLTAHRKIAIAPVLKPDADAALQTIDEFRAMCIDKFGDPLVYAADEMYLIAHRPIPPLKYYRDLPQIENGVGMLAVFLNKAKHIRKFVPQKHKKFITFTGVSFYPFLKDFTHDLKKMGVDIEAVEVVNSLFGPSVTVAGLLTGGDIIKALGKHRADVLLVPDVVLKDGDNVMLDDVSVGDLSSALNMRVEVVGSSPRGLVNAVKGKGNK